MATVTGGIAPTHAFASPVAAAFVQQTAANPAHDIYKSKLRASPKTRLDVKGRQHHMLLLDFEVVDGEIIILSEGWA